MEIYQKMKLYLDICYLSPNSQSKFVYLFKNLQPSPVKGCVVTIIKSQLAR